MSEKIEKRKSPYLLLLDHFEFTVTQFDFALHMKGKMAYWTEQVIKDRCADVVRIGTIVRRMQLTAKERKIAVEHLRRIGMKLEATLMAYKCDLIKARWFPYLLGRVAQS